MAFKKKTRIWNFITKGDTVIQQKYIFFRKALAQFGTEKEDCYIQKRLSPTCIMQKEAIRFETKYVIIGKNEINNSVFSQCARPCKVLQRLFLNLLSKNKIFI